MRETRSQQIRNYLLGYPCSNAFMHRKFTKKSFGPLFGIIFKKTDQKVSFGKCR